MRTAVYARISDDPNGQQVGVDRQLVSCRELANRLGWEIVEEFTDNDISAYSGKHRPGFEQLLVAIVKGQFTGLVVWHVDRLYRDLKDLERLIDVAEVAGVQFETVNSGSFDLASSAGKMMARILGSVARQESEHHAERRREANRKRAVSGAWRKEGSRPFGYDKTGVPLEPEASMLRTAAADILGGKSLHNVARDWNASGVTTVRGVPWTNLHVRRVLTNARIAALRVHQGRIIGPGTWEPILNPDTFEGLLAFLSDPSRKNAVAFERRYMLSGVIRCGHRAPGADPDDLDAICGKPLYASHPHGKDGPMAYCCRPNMNLGRSGAEVEKFVEAVVLGHLMDNDIGSGLREGEKVDVAALRTKRDALIARRSQLGTLFGRGVIDDVALENGTVEINAQIEPIRKQLADASHTGPVPALLADDEDPEALADRDTLMRRWKNASPDVKGKTVAQLMEVIVHPAQPGVRAFDPDLIEIRWK
jgi:site-specific DNA recombinase